MAKSPLTHEVPTREDDDLLERSVKKTKLGDRALETAVMDSSMEVPCSEVPETMMVEDEVNETGEEVMNQERLADFSSQTKAKATYKDTLQGSQTPKDSFKDMSRGVQGNNEKALVGNVKSANLNMHTRFNALYGLEDAEEEINILEQEGDMLERNGPLEVGGINGLRERNGNGNNRNLGQKGPRKQDQRIKQKESATLERNVLRQVGESSKQEEGRKSRQAAAEDDHVVVRGTNGGQVISRTVVESHDQVDARRLLDSIDNTEHHQDPPFR
nr:hypothetical protein Iba_chr06cCG14090 [Ipomoea batatas]